MGLLSLSLAVTGSFAQAQLSPQIPMAGTAVPQYADPLPELEIIVDEGEPIELHMTEFEAQVLPRSMPKTWVWGYLKPGQTERDSYLGPVIITTRGVPTEMKFVNNLGTAATTKVDAYRYSTDQTLHWADPLNDGMSLWNHLVMPPEPGSPGAVNYQGPIPAAVHLHGGEVPPQLDGGPDSWFTSDGLHIGAGYYSMDGLLAKNYTIYRYPNTQEGAPIWFHDHTLGATRLNVYCGLAGGYVITDPVNDPPNLPPLIPLVLQDRMFDITGQLFFPGASAGGVLWALNPEHPYWTPEFLGDVIVVNGKAWPYKEVAPQRYTLLFINGSNARTYEMSLFDPISRNFGPPLWVIGTDGGYLDKPVNLNPAIKGNNKLVIMPGERYTVIVDFAGYETGVIGPNGVAYTGNWEIKNTAKAPYPAGEAPAGATTGHLMQFRVTGTRGQDTSFDPAVATAVRPTPMIRLANPGTGKLAAGVTTQKRRQLTLNEVMGMPQNAIDPVTGVMTAWPGGPLEVLVNNTKFNGKRFTGVMDLHGMLMYMEECRPDFIPDGMEINYLSERPTEGETEIWEIINLTADAHPIHLHLVQFQLMNRQAFDVPKYLAAYDAAFPGGGYDPMTGQPYPPGTYIPGFGPPLDYNTGNPVALGGNPNINAVSAKNKTLYLQSVPIPPLPQEAGWKDTIMVLPGQVTRLVVRWAPTDVPADTPPSRTIFPFDPNGGQGYVWHCHIIDHEDNEMMRPNEVIPQPAAERTYTQGSDY